MAWFDTYTAAPKIYREYAVEKEQMPYFYGNFSTGLDTGLKERKEIREVFDHPGLTWTAATDAADQLNTAKPSSSDTYQNANVVRQNQAGAFKIRVTKTIQKGWQEV